MCTGFRVFGVQGLVREASAPGFPIQQSECARQLAAILASNLIHCGAPQAVLLLIADIFK